MLINILVKSSYELFESYMILFLLYLIWRFVRGNLHTEIKDTILDKDVPSAVFIQNQNLLKNTMKYKIEFDAEKMAQLRA